MIFALLAAAWIYVRGWRQLHRQMPSRYTTDRLFLFLSGLGAIFVALASPLDAFGNLLLQAHMVQHLLLIMIAPLLILTGQPVLPLLRGLPHRLMKNGLGPFLRWRALRRVGGALVSPVVAFCAMALAVIFWHLPRFYELGLRSQGWHELEHACFFFGALLFWWPVVEVWPRHSRTPRWAMIPYLILADFVNTGLSAFLVFSKHVVYPTYALAPRLWGISALGDQAVAGGIMWVPGSIVFLVPAVVVAMKALDSGRAVRPSSYLRPPSRVAARKLNPVRQPNSKTPWDLLRTPILGPTLRHPYFRRAAQTVMFLLAAAIVADGLFGPQVSAMNLAGVLPWTHWRALSVLALLIGGNFFCMACPFTLPRDFARRFLPARRVWPKQLRSKWTAVVLIALYLWAYEAFSLWDSPWWTAWIIVGYFASALLVDGLFQGASFCKYVCPIGQFHFVNSLASPLEVRVREPKVCDSCQTHDCLHGHAGQRGCELYLFQPRKAGNFDCTFCLDCVHACPSDNVGILASPPGFTILDDRQRSGIGRLARLDIAALVLLLVFGAFVNAAGMTVPVIQWMNELQSKLGFASHAPIVAAFYFAGLLVPLALVCALSRPLWRDPGTTLALTLAPLGFSMWIAHFWFHYLTVWSSIIPAAGRALNRRLPFTSLASSSMPAPAWWPPAEILLLDAGLLLTLYLGWRTAVRRANGTGSALGLLTPWATLAVLLYAAGLWILFQPMQMRGMLMP
jgi:cytochrome c oxidase assembly factor CtaG/ferredoxin